MHLRQKASEGSFRQLILRLKQPRPKQRGLPALMALFCKQLALHHDVHLVPIPSWRRRVAHRNPLSELTANGLQRPVQHLLVRSREGLSQHRLDRKLRAQSMLEAFQVLEQPSGQALWLVDDILATGATGIAAYQALFHRRP